ncbi:sigma factor binding protein 1, chloroplastic-like [Neltuma alba]|uniref:sigma factor binding protein 1, chloroplastic-like n=1 Tax=Neltuma alba TaxID=207710 RepID=UPI0010A56C45|nr:sigma factor binding protein 1, chloroplastic-like [Prosopis alba]
MEMLGVNKNPAAMMKWRNQKRNDDVLKKMVKKKKKDIKVTYISSPMKVKTSASNFRALVQELTGQDSNVEEKFLQDSADHGHDDDYENDASMAGASSNNGDEQCWKGHEDHQHEVEEDLHLPNREAPSSWLDLLSEDYCNGFQYSRSLFEPFNQQHMKFDLVEI